MIPESGPPQALTRSGPIRERRAARGCGARHRSAGRFGRLHRGVELGRSACGEELLAHAVLADETGDAGESLDVRARGGLGSDEQEEEGHGLAVEGVELDGLLGTAGGDAEVGYGGGLAVGHGDTVADASGEDGLALTDGAEDLGGGIGSVGVADDLDQLPEEVVLASRPERDAYALRREEVRQQQRCLWLAWFRSSDQGVKLADHGLRIKLPKVGMSKSLRVLGASLALALLATGSARGQELFPEWTMRTRVAPEALARGAEAVYWNPAGVGALEGRSELVVILLESSQDLGLKGFAGAGALRLPRGGGVAVGYQHFGVDDIQRTEDTPQNGTPDLINVADDRFTVAASQPLGRRARVGAMAEYDRSDSGVSISDGVGFGAGALVNLDGALAPELGGSVFNLSGSTRWRAGLGSALPGLTRSPVGLRVAYGISGASDGSVEVQHRLSLTADWRRRIQVSVAGVESKTAAETSISPELMGAFRVGRYALGVVHERVANGFGGATSAHLVIRF